MDLILKLGGGKARILDFGAGAGHLCQRLGERYKSLKLTPRDWITACEITPEVFQYPEVDCVRIAADSRMPFPDASFDLVCAIEVLEHTSRPYDFISEAARVLRPGGHLVFSTPNFLSINSRFSLFWNGFGELYLPPSIKPENAGRICGHIMPLSYPYFHYGLRRCGFGQITLHVDKFKRSALFLAAVLFPFCFLAAQFYRRKIWKYDPAVYRENQEVLSQMNSFKVLAARSCFLTARKQTQSNDPLRAFGS